MSGIRSSPKQFCSVRCRRTIDQAGRLWIRRALADGRLTVADLWEALSNSARAGASGLEGSSGTPHPRGPVPLSGRPSGSWAGSVGTWNDGRRQWWA